MSDLTEAVETAISIAKTVTHPKYESAQMGVVLVDELVRLGYAIHRTDPAKGGRARAEVLSTNRRVEIARNAANARWAKTDKGTDG